MLYILDLSLVKVQYYRMLETILLSALLKRQQFAILKMGVTWKENVSGPWTGGTD
jgi:hypothetical protein